MRILINNYEYPPLGGGAGNASCNIAKELVKLGCEVSILTSLFRGLPRYEVSNGITIYRVPVIRRRLHQCAPWEMMSYVVS